LNKIIQSRFVHKMILSLTLKCHIPQHYHVLEWCLYNKWRNLG
jgi:hypothetical protein